MFRSGLDLNLVADICHPARQPFAGGVDEFGKTGVRADYGASAADDVSPLCGALRGRAQSQIVLVPRSIPVHGLCAAYLSGEPAGHRSVFARSRYQALSPGYPRQRGAQHLGQRECGARLAYLCDLGPVADRNRPPAVCRRTLWGRPERDGLRARCQYHRPVPVGVSMGAVSFRKSGGETAHAVGPAWQHPHVSAHQQWQAARRQCARPVAARAWCLLRHGPRLYRFRAAASPSRGRAASS